MRAQKSGTIFNIASIGGKIFAPLGGWYHASKFALEGPILYRHVIRRRLTRTG